MNDHFKRMFAHRSDLCHEQDQQHSLRQPGSRHSQSPFLFSCARVRKLILVKEAVSCFAAGSVVRSWHFGNDCCDPVHVGECLSETRTDSVASWAESARPYSNLSSDKYS
jgi:hypothetical protein